MILFFEELHIFVHLFIDFLAELKFQLLWKLLSELCHVLGLLEAIILYVIRDLIKEVDADIVLVLQLLQEICPLGYNLVPEIVLSH